MMKLKVRCWNGETMVSPDYIDRDGRGHWYENSIPESTDKVMLWTGLLDKQGVEIYEGDIVLKYTDRGEASNRGRVSISLSSGASIAIRRGDHPAYIPDGKEDETYSMSLYSFMDRGRTMGTFEVIGNIYQDNHLLDTKT